MANTSFFNKVKDIISPSCFIKYGHFLIIAYCLVAALSIALTQIILGVLLLYWVALLLSKKVSFDLNGERYFSADLFYFYLIPVLAWLFISCFSALLGIDPARAFKQMLSTSLYFCFPLVIYSLFLCAKAEGDSIYSRTKVYLFALVLGQSLAAIHSILSRALGFEIYPRIPGAVTESGQLVLVIPAALALVTLANYNNSYVYKKWFDGKNFKVLLLTLLIVALIVNLKRGPWFGVLAALTTIGFFFSRRVLTFSVVIVLVTFFSLSSVRDRLFKGSEDFLIEGGRKQMWTLGAELVQLYPMGIGPDNSRFMRKLDPTLPELHRHMHNNLLNVTVETGWLGVCCYLWWLYQIIGLGFRFWFKNRETEDAEIRARSILTLFIASALLGWQFAGVVEYNFGDSEIRTIALFFMGLILALSLITSSPAGSCNHVSAISSKR